MFTSRNPITRHGSIFRNEKTKQICQIMCVSANTEKGKELFILANFYPYPFEIIREWDAMPIDDLREEMHKSDIMFRYMGEVPYLAEPQED